MKITRFARGYRMRLTDGEMTALNLLMGALSNRMTAADVDALARGLGLKVRRPLVKLLAQRGLRVDQDARPVMKRSRVGSKPLPVPASKLAEIGQ